RLQPPPRPSADLPWETLELRRLGDEIRRRSLADENLRVTVLPLQQGRELEVVVRHHDAERNAEKDAQDHEDQQSVRGERRLGRRRDPETGSTGDEDDGNG